MSIKYVSLWIVYQLLNFRKKPKCKIPFWYIKDLGNTAYHAVYYSYVVYSKLKRNNFNE